MKSTIVFLSLLALISCFSIESYEPALVELSSNPASDAIFATIALQLKADNVQGFDRVIGLLNEFVDDGKKQILSAKKLYRATTSRCEVSSMKFKERNSYFQNVHDNMVSYSNESATTASLQGDNLTFLKAKNNEMTEFKARETTYHAAKKSENDALIANAQEAVDNAQAAINAVQGWTLSTSFIQEKIDKVTNSYLQVHSYKLIVPTSFVETAANDETIKGRLLEWLESLRIAFLETKLELEGSIERYQTNANSMDSALTDLLSLYTSDAEHCFTLRAKAIEDKQVYDSLVEHFQKLADDNSGLIKANDDYCKTEQTEYEKVKDVLENQQQVFKDIREYFRNNYAKISEFIKDKFNGNAFK